MRTLDKICDISDNFSHFIPVSIFIKLVSPVLSKYIRDSCHKSQIVSRVKRFSVFIHHCNDLLMIDKNVLSLIDFRVS